MSVSGISLQCFNGTNHKIIDLTKYSTVWGYPKYCHHNVIVLPKTLKHELNKPLNLLFNAYYNKCKYNRITNDITKAEELLEQIHEAEEQRREAKRAKTLTIDEKVNYVNEFNKSFKLKLLPLMTEEKINEAYELALSFDKVVKKIKNSELDGILNKIKSFN